jgi:hypothetical protein
MVKKENRIKSGYRKFTHMTAVLASHPVMNIAEK